jgi:prepilin-type N-terminal cleavage/methylation domain-containing protein/prepilin-type processing-associated H-X9-DG protein
VTNYFYKRRGFTLIELLVVIAIIALLMGILMPVLGKVREQGKDVICRNNLRQIGIAANLYAEANNIFMPRSAEYSRGIEPWFQLFMPYLSQKDIDGDYRNVDIFHCPSYPDKEQTVCYVVNGWTREDSVRGRSKLTDCSRPGAIIYLADNEYGHWRTIIKNASDRDVTRCDVFREEHLPTSDSEGITDGRRVARDRHKSGCNCLFLDWHVEWMDAGDITEDLWIF